MKLNDGTDTVDADLSEKVKNSLELITVHCMYINLFVSEQLQMILIKLEPFIL